MNFKERWRIAGVIATQMRFDGFVDANPGNVARIKENPERISKSVRSSTRISSLLSTVMIIMIAVLTIGVSGFDTSIGSLNVRIAVSFSFFLLLAFVLIFFLNLTTTTGFFTSHAMELPSILPLGTKELENLAILAYARVFVAPAVATITIFPIACFILFGPITGIVALIGCLATVSMSLRALIGFSRWFHEKSHSSDESKLGTVVRLAATLGLVIGIMSVYSIASYIPFLIQGIITFAEVYPATYIILSFIFPFSFGFLASAVTPGISFGSQMIPFAAVGTSILYAVIAFVFYQQSGKLLRGLALGGKSRGTIGPLKEINIVIRTPLKAVIRKDMRMATKTVGSAIVFAIPIFLMVMIYPMISGWAQDGPIHSIAALTAIAYANLFCGLSVVSVMMFDSQGSSIHEGLPLSSRMVLRGKTVISIIPYTVSMILIIIILAMFNPITPLVLLIPIIATPLGFAVPMIVGASVYLYRGGGRAVAINIGADQKMALIAGLIGAVVGLGPLLCFGIIMMITGSQILSLSSQLAIVIVMVLVAQFQIPRLLKD